MRLTRIPHYTVAELERRAEVLVRSHCGWPPDLPVDIEFLVDEEPGILLDILPGLRNACGVAGLVRYEPEVDRMRVLIDAEVADHPSASFYRFTVAEEFAHILLHRDIMAQVRTVENLEELHAWSGYDLGMTCTPRPSVATRKAVSRTAWPGNLSGLLRKERCRYSAQERPKGLARLPSCTPTFKKPASGTMMQPCTSPSCSGTCRMRQSDEA